MAGSWIATFSSADPSPAGARVNDNLIRRQDNMLPEWVYQECPGISAVHREAAIARQAQLTKPSGALGRLEQLAIELAGLQQTERPRAARVPIIVFAGDHGIVAQGVSAYPQEVTIAMMSNFASGGAAISVLARELGSSLEVVDAGTLAQLPVPGIVTDKPRCGCRDFSEEAALQPAELAFSFECGKRAVLRMGDPEPDLLILGEMGIGNTTASAAIAASLLGVSAEQMAGNGTGVDAAGRARKARLIDAALARHGLASPGSSPEQILCAVGGLEIAAVCGAIIAAAQRRIPILIDGFIVSVAALAAVRLNPSCRPFLLPSHQSAEQGHRLILKALNVLPLVSLDLRLGEGSGAAIALPLVRLACALHNGMATFAQANVPDRPAE
jgi:nicotinate-nucleotide--dimethylbenzimidazole phosphoribosyltransferase